MQSTLEHIIPDISDWPIYKVSEHRSEFIARLNAYVKKNLKESTSLSILELLEKTIYLEKIRVKNNPWKVDPTDDKTYWSDLQKEIKRAHDHTDKDAEIEKILDRVINRYNEEIVGTFKKKTFRFSQRFLTAFFRRLLNPATGKGQRRLWGNRKQLTQKLKVEGHVDEFRSLFSQGTVVIVPTHFSNLDSILIGYTLDAVIGVPAFSYGAGLNLLDNEIVAYFINRLGAYRVDRRKKNPIYLECLKSQASFSLQEGVNQIFFPGGTRARDGKIEKRLKLGLLGSLIEAQRHAIVNEDSNKIFVVPMVLNYHFVLEAKSLINQYLRKTGREKYTRSKKNGKPSQNIMKFIWSLIRKQSDITVSLGEPMDVFGNKVNTLGESMDKNGNIIDIQGYFKLKGEIQSVQQREKVYTKLLGEKIVESFHKNNQVLSSHLVAFAAFRIFMNTHKELEIYDILNLPLSSFSIEMDTFEKLIKKLQSSLKKLEHKELIGLSDPVKLSPRECIKDGIRNLGIYHPEKVLKITKEDIIVSENFRLLFFYHNRLDSYDLEENVNWENYIDYENLELENITE